jgi:hypothetical protein
MHYPFETRFAMCQPFELNAWNFRAALLMIFAEILSVARPLSGSGNPVPSYVPGPPLPNPSLQLTTHFCIIEASFMGQVEAYRATIHGQGINSC